MRAYLSGVFFLCMFAMWDCGELPTCLIATDCPNTRHLCQKGSCVPPARIETVADEQTLADVSLDATKESTSDEPRKPDESTPVDELTAPDSPTVSDESTPSDGLRHSDEPARGDEPSVMDTPVETGISDGGPVPTKQPHLYYLPSEIWKYRIISVCWINPAPNHADQRMWVQSAVQRAWEKVANVMFTGWGTCPSKSDGIRISVGNLPPGVNGSFGKTLSGKSIGMYLDFRSSILSKGHCATGETFESCLRLIARREFAQVLGFRYGYRHPNQLPDWQVTQCIKPTVEKGWVPFGDWDPDSVMNQCNPNFKKLTPGLSRIDDANVQKIYGPRWTIAGMGDASNSRGFISVGRFIYFVAKGFLYEMGTPKGVRSRLGNDTWDDTVGMAHIGGFLYILQQGKLWRFNLTNATRTRLGSTIYQHASAVAALGGKLYLILGGVLRSLDVTTLQLTTVGSDSWPHARLMEGYKGSLYINLNADIWKVDPATGMKTKVNVGNWSNAKAMTFHKDFLYVQANTTIYKLDLANKSFIKLNRLWESVWGLAGVGDALFIQDKANVLLYNLISGGVVTLGEGEPWKAMTAIGASDANLFIVEGADLWRVEPVYTRRTLVRGGRGGWKDSTLIAYDPGGKMLYIKQGKEIWQTNPTTGARTSFLGNASDFTAMTVLNGHLFVVDNAVLKSIHLTTKAVTSVSQSWSGSSAMVVSAGKLYILRGGLIYGVNPTTGVGVPVGSPQLVGVKYIAAFGQYLYIQKDFYLWRLDTVSGETYKIGPDTHFRTTNGIGVVAGHLLVQYGNRLVKTRLP